MATCMDCVTGSCGTRRAPPRAPKQQRVELNVGGKRFTSSRHTLSQCPTSLLAALVSGCPQEDGSYFIDRDPDFFGFILSFLRDGAEHFVPPDDARDCASLLREAKQLGMEELVKLLDWKLAEQADTGEQQALAPFTPPPAATLPLCAPESPGYAGAPIPGNETERIALLKTLDVLYTSPEHQYDCIADVVAALFDMPIVLVSLVSTSEQWFKAKCGLLASTTSRNSSFCAFTFKPEDPKRASMLVIEDARRDPRVADNPLVTGEPYIQFYAGAPLVTSCGLRLGALCCIDRVPRAFTFAQAKILVNFAHLTTQYLEASQLVEDIDNGGSSERGLPQEVSNGSLDFTAGVLRRKIMQDGLKEMVLLVWARPDSNDWPMLYANHAWTMATGLIVKPPQKFPGPIEVVNMQSDSLAVPGISLWHHMRCASQRGAAKLNSFCQALPTFLSQPNTGGTRVDAPMFSLSTTIRRSSGEETKVLCRFSPADKPLDEAASTTRPTLQASADHTPVSPNGFPPGMLYFVVIVEQRAGTINVVRGVTPESAHAVLSEVSDPVCQRLELTNLRRSVSEQAGRPGGPETTPVDVARDESSQGSVGPQRFPYDDIDILRLVGEGSFGKVYRGLWNGMSVAVKVICVASSMRQRLTLSPDIEAELSSLVSHPNLVTTYQYGLKHCSSNRMEASLSSSISAADLGGMEMWIVQEWCDGGTLGDYCKFPRVEGAGILEACDIALEIGRGIAYLHDRYIIHGDLTPSNVMLTSQPTKRGYTYKVCDFGRARICDKETQAIMTQTMGTVTHMLPELFVSNIDLVALSPKADVYALGMIMYQVVTAKSPFEGLSAPQVVVRVAGGSSLHLPDEVPQNLKRVYVRSVSREPTDRPDAKTLIEDIEKVKQELCSRSFKSPTFA